MPDLSGESFKAEDVAAHYVHRPPYPPELFTYLAEIAPLRRRLLDLGCGEGKLARPLSAVFEEVTAVDPSAAMMQLGRSLERGNAANINWVLARAEEAPLSGRFDLTTFAASIHWMDPDLLFAKLRRHVAPDHVLAFVEGDTPHHPPWEADWQSFLGKWVPLVTGRPVGSKAWRDFRSKHIASVAVVETKEFLSQPFRQTVEDFVRCQHSRNTFSMDNLGERVETFQGELTELLTPYAAQGGLLSYRVLAQVTVAKLP